MLLTVLLGVAAVVGGGLLTAGVFRLVDRGEEDADSVAAAGSSLPGGLWIGALERLAVYAALVTGWPEGIALVLGVKGLGRYPELKNPADNPGTAERFIIGTFTSVLWACGCAALLVELR